MNEDVEAEASQDGVFELGVLVHDDGHDADVREEPAGTSNDIFPEKTVIRSGDNVIKLFCP
jgi:hypothetical protein